MRVSAAPTDGLAAGWLVQPVTVFARNRGSVFDPVVGCGEEAEFAAFAEHRDARDEVELGSTFGDAIVRAADVL